MNEADLLVDTENVTRYRLIDGDTIEDVGTGIRRKITAKELQGIEFSKTTPEEILRIVAATSAQGDFRDDLRNGIGPRPVRLIAESIDVDAIVTPVGLDRNRAIAVPRRADITGWWSGGYAPGEIGPTVIVGHYDSKKAEGIFSQLKNSEEDDVIRINDSDGSVFIYKVVKVEHLKKTKFPTERVYGETAASTLRLVTCGGKFDRKAGHYLENTIVYADLQSVVLGPGRNRGDRENELTLSTSVEPRRRPDVDWSGTEQPLPVESTLASAPGVGSTFVTPTTLTGGTSTTSVNALSTITSSAPTTPATTTPGQSTAVTPSSTIGPTPTTVPTTTTTTQAPTSTTAAATTTTVATPVEAATNTTTTSTAVSAAVTVPNSPTTGAVPVANTTATVVGGEAPNP